MGSGAAEPSTVVVAFRRADDLTEVVREWCIAGTDELGSADPWRTFRWHLGQRHYSGTYWSSTTQGSVIYESRLELARSLFADFDAEVQHIVAQPFLLRATVDRKLRKHIPDYLLITHTGPVIVDVKPLWQRSDPKVAFTFEWKAKLSRHVDGATRWQLSRPQPNWRMCGSLRGTGAIGCSPTRCCRSLVPGI
jgi:hypothetical protein